MGPYSMYKNRVVSAGNDASKHPGDGFVFDGEKDCSDSIVSCCIVGGANSDSVYTKR